MADTNHRSLPLEGVGLFPVGAPSSFIDDDVTDAYGIEDPFHSTTSVELPQNWAGAVHERLARAIEQLLERWELVRLRMSRRRLTAAVTVVATALVVVVGVIVAAAALVRAETPTGAAKSFIAGQSETADTTATARVPGSDVGAQVAPIAERAEPELSVMDARRIARADRAQTRRHRMRHRRSRRR